MDIKPIDIADLGAQDVEVKQVTLDDIKKQLN